MINISGIALELAEMLRQQTGIGTFGALPTSPNEFPCIVVRGPESITYITTYGNTGELTLPIDVYALSGDVFDSWKRLYELLSYGVIDAPVSIPDALTNHTNPTNYRSLLIAEATDFNAYESGMVSAKLTLTIQT